MTVTVWQKKTGLHPTRAGEERLENPTEEAFDAAVGRVLATIAEEATPFQIVAQVGHSSRACQLEPGWNPARVKSDLWAAYRKLTDVNG